MRSEQELRKMLEECRKVASFGVSNGPCPMEDGKEGCCAECSAPSTIEWVLGENDNPTANGQNRLIDILKD